MNLRDKVLAKLSDIEEREREMRSDCSDHNSYMAGSCDAALEVCKELRPLITALVEVASEAKDCLWLNECKCDEAYTSRNRHAPNTTCGEMDLLVEKLKALAEVVGDD